jgi:hypothetical protein
MLRRPRFQLGAFGPMKINSSTNAPGAVVEIVFSKSLFINLI